MTKENKESDFSKFFRTATPEEKKKLFLEVAKEASKDQKKILEPQSNSWDLNLATMFTEEITYSEVKDFIKNLLSSERQKVIEMVQKMIIDELNIAHVEGTPTSRLTSLVNRLSQEKNETNNP